MSYKRKPIYQFESKDSTGIDKVPLSRLLVIEDFYGAYKQFIKNSSANLTENSTIEDAFNLGNLTSIAGDGFITTPQITQPIQDSTDIAIATVLECTPFATSTNVITSHLSTDWQISTSNTFSTITFQALDSTSKLSIVASNLEANTQYFARVRHKSVDFVSDWGMGVSYTTTAAGINTPTLSITGGTTDVIETPEFTGSTFTVTNDTDTHVSTTWEIYQGTTLIWASVADTSNKTSITVPSGELLANETYEAKITYNGAKYTSATSSVSFSTLASFIDTPVLSGPSSANEMAVINITIDNYDVANTYVISVTDGSYLRTTNTIAWTLPSVVADIQATMTVYATVMGMNSGNAVKVVDVLNIPIVADSAIVVTDYLAVEDINNTFTYV